MKKKVKALVVAASVAAIAGIGAVSFAAWAGGANGSGTATGNTGSINAYGFDTTLSATMGTTTLMPYDQGGTLGTDEVAVWSVALPTITAAPETKLQVKLTSDPGLDASSGIYVMYSTTDVTTAPSDKTGYQKLTTTDADLGTVTFAENSEAATTGYLVVILDSSKLGDMGKAFSITVTVAEA